MDPLLFSKEELGGGKRFDAMHEAMAVRAVPYSRCCDGKHFSRRGLVEPGAAER